MLKNIVLTIMVLTFPMLCFSYEYVPGQVIVKFKKKASASSYVGISAVAQTGVNIMSIDDSKDVLEAVDELKNDPNIEYAEPNYIFHISTVPNDTSFSTLWGLKNTGQTISCGSNCWPNNPGTNGDDIDAETAWSTITNCNSITVAVIDTGVKYAHTDLSANMWEGTSPYVNHGYDFVNSDYNPFDDNGHGTHVSGIIGAVGNNSTGVTGVCWHVKIMALKVFDACGLGSTTDIATAIDFAVSKGAKIINASFNLAGPVSSTLSDSITRAEHAGVLIVAAAGNGQGNDGVAYNVDTSVTKTYPCCFTQENVMCVAAMDQKFKKASFSNYGPTSVDVGAPGVHVYSTWSNGYPTTALCNSTTCCDHPPCCTQINADYNLESGTSQATPYTVGVAALVWANNPTYNYMDVKNAVMYGGVAVSVLSGITVSGNIINAAEAINYINTPTGLAVVVAN